MAKYTAFVAADTVGDTNTVTPWTATIGVAGGVIVAYPADYLVMRYDSTATNLDAYMGSMYTPPSLPNPGVDKVTEYWEADGNPYSLITLSMMLGPGTTAKNEDVKQFYFEYDDKIRGSEYDDMLCGWDGDDKMWGFEGDDKFYFGEDMDKDTICDFSKNDDEIIFDDSIAEKLKDFKKVKYNENKEFTKFKGDDGDQLKVYGIYTKKDVRKVIEFEDFTDFG